jgi:hypothetical protein
LSTLLAALALLMTSCGTSDYLESVSLTSNGASAGGFFNLAGVDGTIQLVVTANYHSGKTINVTNNSTFTMVPTGCVFSDSTGIGTVTPTSVTCVSTMPAAGPTTVTISPTGLMTGIAQMCTWVDPINTTATPNVPYSPPEWEYTGYYQTTATYRNFTSQPVGVGVGVTSSNVAGCGPS